MSVIDRPGWLSPARLGVDPDVVLAVALAFSQAVTIGVGGGGSIGSRLVGALAALGFVTLAWRRRYPLGVLVITFAVVFVQELVAPRQQTPQLFLAILLASYSLGAHAERRSLLLGILLGIAGVAIGHALGPSVRGFSDASADVFFAVLLVLAPTGVGRMVRSRSELVGRLEVATGRLRSLREQRLSSAVARERERIADQLEQVMVSGLGTIDAHADVSSLEDVVAVEDAARTTLRRMRSLLAGLRSEPSELTPSRSLSELHVRVNHALAAGLEPGQRATHKPDPPKRLAMLSESRVDFGLSILAGLLAIGAAITTFAADDLRGPRLLDAFLAAASVLPIATARRAPLPATAVGIVALLAYARLAAPADPLSGVAPAGLLIVFPLATGAGRDRSTAVIGLALCLAAVAAVVAADPHAAASGLPASAAVIVAGWAAGWVLASRTRMLSALADTAAQIEREQNALAEAQRRQERARVARELHDAFAHAMTVIVVQAQAARRVWRTDPQLASGHARVLRATLQETLGELHDLVSALGSGSGRAAVGPGLLRLVEQARAAGMDVELSVDGDTAALSTEIELTVYRIIQEAITNAVRHAPGATVHLHVHRDERAVSVEVTNGPPREEPAKGYGGGEGVRGMRERATSCGGELEAQQQPGGGFRVQARLPLSEPR